MSLALGMHTNIVGNRGYQGWYDEAWFYLWPFESNYEHWTKDMWGRLGLGYNVGDAMTFAIGRQPGSSDPNAPINSFRFKGQGNIDQIQLVGN